MTPQPEMPITPREGLRRAVFFDRDDTLIACREVTSDGDLGDPALVRLLPGALEACRELRATGWFLAVVSNQGGVARGKYGLDQVGACNDRLNELVGGVIDAFRFCPYHPRGTVCGLSNEHPWRKPAPGMLLDVAEKHAVDLAASWMVGDAERDIEAGLAAGCRTILIIQESQSLDRMINDGCRGTASTPCPVSGREDQIGAREDAYPGTHRTANPDVVSAGFTKAHHVVRSLRDAAAIILGKPR